MCDTLISYFVWLGADTVIFLLKIRVSGTTCNCNKCLFFCRDSKNFHSEPISKVCYVFNEVYIHMYLNKKKSLRWQPQWHPLFMVSLSKHCKISICNTFEVGLRNKIQSLWVHKHKFGKFTKLKLHSNVLSNQLDTTYLHVYLSWCLYFFQKSDVRIIKTQLKKYAIA